jgi:RES domain-containing protein
MSGRGRVHDRTLLDALESLAAESVAETTWRITRAGRDPLRGSAAGGRWSPSGEFEVLYTSLEREGALAEIGFRLSLEPVWPSRFEHALHSIAVKADRALRLADLSALAPLGVDIDRYGTFAYGGTQALAVAAHFMEFDGLIVPSARHASSNFVIFMDRLGPGCALELLHSEPVDWHAWRAKRR